MTSTADEYEWNYIKETIKESKNCAKIHANAKRTCNYEYHNEISLKNVSSWNVYNCLY